MIERQRGRRLPLASHWVRVGGRRMHFRASAAAHGERLPVVLVHGLAVSGRYLLPTAAALVEEYAVYVPDLPGFGASEAPPWVMDIGETAEALGEWMEAVGLEQAYLLGNSMGCHTIAALAAQQAGRIVRAVLVSPVGDPGGRNALRLLGRAGYEFVQEPGSLLPILLQDYLRAGTRRTLLTFRNLLESRLEAWLPLLEAPTLVVGGGKDRIVPLWWLGRVAALLPQGEAAVIPEAGHVANFSHPERLAALTRAFFENGGGRWGGD